MPRLIGHVKWPLQSRRTSTRRLRSPMTTLVGTTTADWAHFPRVSPREAPGTRTKASCHQRRTGVVVPMQPARLPRSITCGRRCQDIVGRPCYLVSTAAAEKGAGGDEAMARDGNAATCLQDGPGVPERGILCRSGRHGKIRGLGSGIALPITGP